MCTDNRLRTDYFGENWIRTHRFWSTHYSCMTKYIKCENALMKKGHFSDKEKLLIIRFDSFFFSFFFSFFLRPQIPTARFRYTQTTQNKSCGIFHKTAVVTIMIATLIDWQWFKLAHLYKTCTKPSCRKTREISMATPLPPLPLRPSPQRLVAVCCYKMPEPTKGPTP